LKRSFVIVAVLVVVTSALLVATGLLFLVQAELSTDSGLRARTQSRLLAWSGVRAIMADLDEQRDEILGGEPARFEREIVVYEAAGREGDVRLLRIGLDGEVLPDWWGRRSPYRSSITAMARWAARSNPSRSFFGFRA
jgi:hypothetical protein